MKKPGLTPAIICAAVAWISGLALHLYTCWLAYQVWPLWQALLALFLPGPAELLWFITSGDFGIYQLLILLWLLLVLPIARHLTKKAAKAADEEEAKLLP